MKVAPYGSLIVSGQLRGHGLAEARHLSVGSRLQ